LIDSLTAHSRAEHLRRIDSTSLSTYVIEVASQYSDTPVDVARLSHSRQTFTMSQIIYHKHRHATNSMLHDTTSLLRLNLETKTAVNERKTQKTKAKADFRNSFTVTDNL